MFTLISAIIGFIASSVPQLLQLFTAKADRKHELDILKIQVDLARLNILPKLEEARSAQNIEGIKDFYSMYNSGTKWVQYFDTLVKAIVTFSLLGIYITIQYLNYNNGDLVSAWTKEDHSLLTICISYYFGTKLMSNI